MLRIPEALLPKDFPPSPQIQVIKTKKEKEKESGKQQLPYQRSGSKQKSQHPKEKAGDYQKARLAYKNAYVPWTPELDSELKALYQSGQSLSELAGHFNRNKGAILSRLKKQGWLAFE